MPHENDEADAKFFSLFRRLRERTIEVSATFAARVAARARPRGSPRAPDSSVLARRTLVEAVNVLLALFGAGTERRAAGRRRAPDRDNEENE